MHSARFFQRVLLLCLQGVLMGQLWADPAPSPLPATVMPEQVSRSFSQQLSMQPKFPGAPIQRPEAQPTVNSALAEKAKKLHFRLNKIILEGNHVYTDAVLRPLYQDKLNKVITVLDLFQIAQNITAFYSTATCCEWCSENQNYRRICQ
jgi:hemolysin activation/secretion protein